MQNIVQSGKFALLFVLAFVLCGCSEARDVYVAGPVRTQDSAETEESGTEAYPEGTGSAEEKDAGQDAEWRLEEPEAADERDSGTEWRPEAADERDADSGTEGHPGSMDERGAASGTDQLPAKQEGVDMGRAEPESEGYVYVCGAVKRPGVYPVREGMRIFEALELAGGFAEDADCEWLNQAEPVRDGQRLYVYTQEETRRLRECAQENGQLLQFGDSGTVPENPGATAGETLDSDERKINLNTADREELKTLPGIGDAKADAIVQYREEHGPFASIEEIQNISGIKNAVFSKIRDLITV